MIRHCCVVRIIVCEDESVGGPSSSSLLLTDAQMPMPSRIITITVKMIRIASCIIFTPLKISIEIVVTITWGKGKQN
jgi:hypothetical protein